MKGETGSGLFAVGSWRLPGTVVRRLRAACGLLALLLLPACSVNYSFSGGDPGDARTVSVDLFETRAPLATPSAAQGLTETVRDLMLAQTRLRLAQREGDVQYSGTITGYDVQPVNIQASETAALNRLTITATITFVNTLDPKKNSEFTVSRFADYNSSQDLTAVEVQLVDEIGKQLAQDIFDRTLGNW